MGKIAYIMIGASGSGKSTLIKHITKEKMMLGGNPKVSTFSLDSCRMNFIHTKKVGQWWSDNDSDADMYAQAFECATEHEKEFKAFVDAAWAEALKADALFIDNTNLSRKSRTRWIAEARQKGFTVWAVQVMSPLKTVIDRQSTRRDKSVPTSVVRDMYFRQEEILVPGEADFLFVADGTSKNPTLHSVIHFDNNT